MPRFRVHVLVGSAVVASGLGFVGVSGAQAAPPTSIDIVGPTGSGAFGEEVLPLPNGNIVVVDRFFDLPGTADVGAVHLYDGDTLTKISTLTGSTADDRIGYVTVLASGDFVVFSPTWDNGAVVDAGAATWVNAETGEAGVVSAGNSLVGTTTGDGVGSWVEALANGNYVVVSDQWDNGATTDVGAVTWASGATGITGPVTTINSLHGSTSGDRVGSNGVTELSNGNYVVTSPQWDNGPAVNAGAATWADGTTGITGPVTTINSLHGTSSNDEVAIGGVLALSGNGNYVVSSAGWNDGATLSVGAATWGDGSSGVTGAVSSSNSLIGTTASDSVGNILIALTNGNYVAIAPTWDDGATANVGAATWGNGSTGTTGAVTTANSLHGSSVNDGLNPSITALTNGNYVVGFPSWDDGATADVGSVTWGNGSTGTSGTISTANSLYGGAAADGISSNGILALTNGNYVVVSPNWSGNKGAATWGDGSTGSTGVVSAANSLVGSTSGDRVSGSGVYGLTNGNYVVASGDWNDGAETDAGAVTWADGSTGITGPVTTANSLHGSKNHLVGAAGVAALTTGDYVVQSYVFDDVSNDIGAATWADGATGLTGAVTTANSLHGTVSSNLVGEIVRVLPNGGYLVVSPGWDIDGTSNTGAVTIVRPGDSTVGPVTSTNSVLGSAANGGSRLVTAFEPVHGYVVVGRPADNVVTFVYPAATVTVTKTTDGTRSWSFSVAISPTPPGEPSTRGVTNVNPTATWSNLVPGVTYTISEQSVPGWLQGDVVCTGIPRDVTADATFTVAPGSSVTCSIINTELPVTGFDPREWTVAALFALGVGLVLAAFARRVRDAPEQ